LVYEKLKDFKSAVETYQKIKIEYPKSEEVKTVDAYIARAEVQL
jgi:hypothetical protein